MKRIPKKGNLLKTCWFPVSSAVQAPHCYTCVFYDNNSLTPSIEFREQTYETVVKKVYFCEYHGQKARVSEERIKTQLWGV